MRRNGRSLYGWVVVATSAVGLLFGGFPIVVSSYAVFFKSYIREFHAGRGDISLPLAIHNFVAALLAAWIGRLIDRFGARKVILPGLCILGLVLLLAKAIGSRIWQLYVFYSILGAVSGTTTSIPYSVVVSKWFNRHRGLALGLTQAGLGAGAVIVPPMMQLLITRFGWRSAFAVAGATTLIIPMPLVALFLREAPQRVRRQPDGASARTGAPAAAEGLTWPEIRKTRTFWLMLTAFVLAGASVQGCIVHSAELFSDGGASTVSAGLAVSTAGFALLAGRAATGFFLDRCFGPHVAMSLFAVAAVGIALLGLAGVPALVGVFLAGLAFGAELDIIAYLMGRYFGLRSLGTAFGFAFGAFVLAGGIGPLIMGFGFDHTGSYRAPLAGFFFATVLAAALLGRLGPYRFAVTQKTGAPSLVRSGV